MDDQIRIVGWVLFFLFVPVVAFYMWFFIDPDRRRRHLGPAAHVSVWVYAAIAVQLLTLAIGYDRGWSTWILLGINCALLGAACVAICRLYASKRKESDQGGVAMKHHPVVHFEIGCREGRKTRDFFSKLFGWEISGHDAGMIIDTGGAGDISGHIVELAPEWGNYVTVYVEVEDLDAYLKKAGELGGKTLVPPVTLPGKGSFAWLAAPEGNIIGIWRSE